ncbi:MAG: S1 RNA-binding domain-containing protein [Deltaproteobacteria bacterium]|nr:S1 RNA-binding domain-containing protein [Deltaproteobacteria bacterium]
MAEDDKGAVLPTKHEHVERRRRPAESQSETETSEDPSMKQTVPGRHSAIVAAAAEEAKRELAAEKAEPAPAPELEAPKVEAAPEAPKAEPAKPAEPQASFADLFDGASVPATAKLAVGDAVEGPVIQVGADGIFVDAGGHQQAFYPRAELLDAKGKLTVAVGDVIRGHVVRIGDDGTPELGRRLGKGMSLDELETARVEGIQVEGKVVGVNKGGVSVDLGGVRAFCPISQLDRVYVADASVFLQKTLRFVVTQVDQAKKDVVLSRKVILEAEAQANRDALLSEMNVGDIRTGTIVRVRDFGAFVELAPGIDGLIPNREISHDRRRADQVVHTGQSVEVKIQEITRKGDDLRISLSLKAMGDDPWDSLERVAAPGAVAQGVVRKVMDFGVFVELAPGIEGLLHVSELGGGDRHPNSQFNVGQPLLVTVQSIDRDRKRISLAPAPKGATAGQRVDGNQPQVGDIVKVTVSQHERYGVFVQIEGLPGRAGRGLIHEKELGLSHGVDVKKAFPIGAVVDAKVTATGKLALSIKAIAEDEARREVESYKATQSSKSMGTLGDLLAGLKK